MVGKRLEPVLSSAMPFAAVLVFAVCFLVVRLHSERKEGVPYTRTKGRQKEKEGGGARNRKVREGYEAGNGGARALWDEPTTAPPTYPQNRAEKSKARGNAWACVQSEMLPLTAFPQLCNSNATPPASA